MPHEGARVEPVDSDDASRSKTVSDRLLAPLVREAVRKVARGETRDLNPRGFHVRSVEAVIADVRGGHHDDLPAVGRVRQRLLIARHSRIEDDLAEGRSDRPDRPTGKTPAVFEDENGARTGAAHNVLPTAAAMGRI